MGKLSQKSVKLIELLLSDPTIKGNLIDDQKKELYKTITICENGDIILGKTRCLWWNRLIGDEKILSFTDFAFKTVAALSGQKSNVNDILLKGLSEEVIRKAILDDQFDMVVDRLFDAARYGVEGNLSTSGFSISDKIDRHIHIKSEDGVRMVRLPGSGDPLCRVTIGVKGIDWVDD